MDTFTMEQRAKPGDLKTEPLPCGKAREDDRKMKILEILYSLWCDQNGLELVSIEEVNR